MTRIILHVGHGKTGSTALQSAFACSVDALAAQGIHYPDHPMNAAAAAGQINSGNAVTKKLITTAKAGLKQATAAVLLSNETLFHDMLKDPALLSDLRGLGAPIDIVLYIRNPLAHAISVYGQIVKRGGSARDLRNFLPNYRIPGKVAQFLDMTQAAGVTVHVLNYSNHAADLLASFERVADLAPGMLIGPDTGRINRSLTRAELYLQRAFNVAWGRKSSQFISDPLCNALPDIPGERPALTRADYDVFADLVDKPIKRANKLLPASEGYVLERYDALYGDGDDDENLTFTPEQLDVLAQAISARIPDVTDNDAFRDFVIAAQPGARLSAADIALLTDVALKLRPDAPMLVKKQAALQAGRGFAPDWLFLLRERAKRLLKSR